ncbi:MAG: UDP-N-acetylmuramoyl-L-alanine--D-glutamate ligase [Desulfatiglandales bacterium]
MEFAGKKVLVVGLGKSGLSVCRYLCGRGAVVTVSELRQKEILDRSVIEGIARIGAELEFGGHRPETFLGSEMIIVSPGVPLDIGPLNEARDAGIPILGEMELASRLIHIPIAAVTGTNGKSTTTALLGAMAGQAGKRTFVGGNIGIPFIDCVLDNSEAEVAVVEVSSFQLDAMKTFRPDISMILNLSPDHLDRYRDYEAYVASKFRIFENQGPGHFLILNDDDERLSRVRTDSGVGVLRYGLEARENRQAFLEKGKLRASPPGGAPCEFALGRFRLPGKHNLQNLMGAVLAGLVLGLGGGSIQETIDAFGGLPHRVEFVGRFRDVDFYDDSKATNVEAAARSVEGFDRPVILIAGGRHKGADYGPLVEASRGRVTEAVLLGESRDLLKKSFEGIVPIRTAETMEEAVSLAFAAANPRDVVLLAPACSSFDMFTDYVHRGNVFRETVERVGHGR